MIGVGYTPALQELLEESAQLGDANARALRALQPSVQPVLQFLPHRTTKCKNAIQVSVDEAGSPSLSLHRNPSIALQA